MLSNRKSVLKPVSTRDTAATGAVMPRVTKGHTVPVTLEPLLKKPQIYPDP
jgi:hypothetical protein